MIPIVDYERTALVEEDPYRGNTQGIRSACVEITEEGEVSLETYSPGQGMSALKWHGCTLSIPLLDCADAEDVVSVLRGEKGQALLRCVIGGHSVEYSGCRYMAHTTDAAADALFKLEQLLKDVEIVGVWHAGDWLAPATDHTLGLTASTTDEQIEKMADECKSCFASDCPTEVLLGDMAEVLRWRRDQID